MAELKAKIIDPKRRSMIDAKYAIHHVGYKNWEIISRNIGQEMDLWRSLYDAGNKDINGQPQVINHLYSGEDNYLNIRPELEKKGIVIGQKILNKTGKKITITKADKIRQENIARKIKMDMDDLLKTMLTIPILSSQPINFNYKFVEVILVRMMIQCRNLIQKFQQVSVQYATKSTSKYTKPEEMVEAENEKKFYHNELAQLIIGYNKIFHEKEKNPLISTTCLSDLMNWILHAKEIIKFDATEIIIKMPELIFKTCYDNMLEHKQAELYPSQKEIMEFITSEEKYLALVHTMLAAGKTSMVLPISKWLIGKKGKTKLIYCCPNDIVLLEVARMAYGMAISFAIVIHNRETNELEYKWSTFADKTNPKETAILYLCDIYVARIFLENRARYVESRAEYLRENKRDPANNPLIGKNIPVVPDYILMGDELTKDADSQTNFNIDSNFSLTTEIFIDLMRLAPPKIILMSATLPTLQQLPEFYQSIIDAHPGMVTKSFSSSEAKIGCALISNAGELYAPHMGCETVEDIKRILLIIKTNPFIGRFYTFEVLLLMVETNKQIGLPVPDLSIMFNDPSQANQTNIQKTAYLILEQLIASGSDSIIKQTCQMKKNVAKPINLSTILTMDIARFSNSCLVFSSDPIATAYQIYCSNFDHFLSQNSERNIFQQVRMDNILSNYQREMDLFNKALKRIEDKADDGINKRNKETNKKERNKTESWQITSQMLDKKPVWQFPTELQLCSEAHLRKCKISQNIGSNGFVCPEDLPQNSSVPMDILTMLASGIGIYSTNILQLDEEYLQCVIDLAKKGIIKFIITDSSIAYGTNLAVSDIIMIDEPVVSNNGTIIPSIVDKHSIKTIFQMLGRAGRGGNLSYEARIYTTSTNNKLINIIGSYVRGTLDEGARDEIQNIRRAYQILWNNS